MSAISRFLKEHGLKHLTPFWYVRYRYGIILRRFGRVRTVNGAYGTITCARGGYVYVRLDGEKRSGRYHPKELVYYPARPEPVHHKEEDNESNEDRVGS
ncbi:hypothetical protein M0R72_06525 [Candidatus Pacearchaeota archaeon]|nr:hypothetical protein [Candidatus Pacearchaeota archaeon]